jgi:hypothetical protein
MKVREPLAYVVFSSAVLGTSSTTKQIRISFMFLRFGTQVGNANHIYKPAQQVSQRDAPPVGGFEVWFFIRVQRLRFAFVSGAPLTVTLGCY